LPNENEFGTAHLCSQEVAEEFTMHSTIISSPTLAETPKKSAIFFGINNSKSPPDAHKKRGKPLHEIKNRGKLKKKRGHITFSGCSFAHFLVK